MIFSGKSEILNEKLCSRKKYPICLFFSQLRSQEMKFQIRKVVVSINRSRIVKKIHELFHLGSFLQMMEIRLSFRIFSPLKIEFALFNISCVKLYLELSLK